MGTKKIMLLLALSFAWNSSAQAKQTRVQLEQIGALKIYIGYAKKGYSIVRHGLSTIGDLKQGDLDIHTGYFSSLKKVNPKVRNYGRVIEILQLQERIMQACANLPTELLQDTMLSDAEMDYAGRVFERLNKSCELDLEVLEATITDGVLEMKDDERLRRIDELYWHALDNYTFCRDFRSQLRRLSLSRRKDINDVESGRSLHGLKMESR